MSLDTELTVEEKQKLRLALMEMALEDYDSSPVEIPGEDSFFSGTRTLRMIAESAIKRMKTVGDVHAVFGAPGDFGYDTKLGALLQALYSKR